MQNDTFIPLEACNMQKYLEARIASVAKNYSRVVSMARTIELADGVYRIATDNYRLNTDWSSTGTHLSWIPAQVPVSNRNRQRFAVSRAFLSPS